MAATVLIQHQNKTNKNKDPRSVAKELPIDTLHELLILDGDAGTLTWKTRDVKWFTEGKKTAQHNANRINSRFAGKPALTAVNGNGYKHGAILGKNYKSHRVIFAMATGAWPEGVIDHIDGDPLNNRIDNLRDVTLGENQKNQKLHSTNTSGVVCVSWSKKSSKWAAEIGVGNNKNIKLGSFTDKADAIAARQAAEIEYGFHANHGRAAS